MGRCKKKHFPLHLMADKFKVTDYISDPTPTTLLGSHSKASSCNLLPNFLKVKCRGISSAWIEFKTDKNCGPTPHVHVFITEQGTIRQRVAWIFALYAAAALLANLCTNRFVDYSAAWMYAALYVLSRWHWKLLSFCWNNSQPAISRKWGKFNLFIPHLFYPKGIPYGFTSQQRCLQK